MADGDTMLNSPVANKSINDGENILGSHLNGSAPKEDSPLLSSTGGIKPYSRRWYVLLVFSYAGIIQTIIWNTWGPIAQSAKLVFGWTDANIGMLANWGSLMHCVFMIPVAYVMDVKGLRVSMLFCSLLMLLGAAIRCITSEPGTATWLINIACIINGIAGTVSFGGPALVSATWFPPEERATATAISSISSYVGLAIAFIMGPEVVPEPDHVTGNNMTDVIPSNMSDIGHDTDIMNITQSENILPQRDGIMRLMYIECGAAGLLFLMVLVYFPAKPPSPPSLSASIKRASYVEGLKQLVKHKQFLLVLTAYSIPIGVSGVFSTVLDLVLNGLDVSQNTAGWIGFYATVAGCLAALFISRIADIFMRRMKALLLFLYVMATIVTVWFIIIALGFIPFNLVSLYISFILNGVFINGSIPLFYELSCEAAYPVAEGVTAGTLTVFANIVGVSFLSVLQIPHIGVLWMNWTLLGTVIITLPILLIFKEKYNRMDIDTTTQITSDDTGHTKSVNADNERSPLLSKPE